MVRSPDLFREQYDGVNSVVHRFQKGDLHTKDGQYGEAEMALEKYILDFSTNPEDVENEL